MSEEREKDMAVNKEQPAATVLKNEEVLKLAKKGMSKYRKTLGKLAKN